MTELSSSDQHNQVVSGGYFEFDDGGCYAGDWVNGQAYGYGKCTGPQGKGEYSGTWNAGFEVSGVYTWPNGSTYAGDWLEGKRGGLGVEMKGNWVYKGEWINGLKAKIGVRFNLTSEAKYEGSWLSGVQDGLGVETYIDESTYQGQWSKGMRHGFGVRKSVPRGIASIYHSSRPSTSLKSSTSLPSGLSNRHSSSSSQDGMYGSMLDNRKLDDSDRDKGGFVLVEKSKNSTPNHHHSLQRSRSFSLSRTLSKRIKAKRSESMNGSKKSEDNVFSSDPSNLCGAADTGRNSLLACSVDVSLASVVEVYAGEWKNDKRCGFGISQRSDGLRYEGEWFNDKRCGYGVTVLKDASRQEGKYRNNELISSLDQKRKIFTRKKFKDHVDVSVGFARKAAENAAQKSEMALTKRRAAVAKAELADEAAKRARYYADVARTHAEQFEIHFQTADQSPLNSEETRINLNKGRTKQVARGESADSQISSWSSSSQHSARKISSGQNLHEPGDDNVFIFPTPIFSKAPSTVLTTQSDLKLSDRNSQPVITESSRVDNLKSSFYVKDKSVDESSQTGKLGRHQSDRRDYFGNSPPEIIRKAETMPNGYILPQFSQTKLQHLPIKTYVHFDKSSNFTPQKEPSIDISTFDNLKSDLITQSKTFDTVASIRGYQTNFSTIDNDSTFQRQNSSGKSSLSPESSRQETVFETRVSDLRRRFSTDNPNRKRITDSSDSTYLNYYSKTSPKFSQLSKTKPGDTQETADRVDASQPRSILGMPLNPASETPTNPVVDELLLPGEDQKHDGDPNFPRHPEPGENKDVNSGNGVAIDFFDLQNWLQQNLLTIFLVVVNFTFSAVFFGFWSSKD